MLGLDKAVPRFLPIYEEHGDRGKVLGTLLLAAGTVLTLGLAFVLLAFGLHGFAGGDMGGDGQG